MRKLLHRATDRLRWVDHISKQDLRLVLLISLSFEKWSKRTSVIAPGFLDDLEDKGSSNDFSLRN